MITLDWITFYKDLQAGRQCFLNFTEDFETKIIN